MMDKSAEETYYKLAFGLVSGIGKKIAKNLIDYCGSPEGVFKEKTKNLLKIPGVGPVLGKAIRNRSNRLAVSKELKFIDEHGIKILFFLDEDFPYRLRLCSDCPVLLYYKGKNHFNSDKILSIVGTRKPNHNGMHFTKKLVESFYGTDILLVSGLAFGIDGIVHNSALENDIQTSGVLGHGLNIAYPWQHKKLYSKMAEKGSLITEFSSQDKFYKQNFARRNRIVAGMADAVLVVESGIKGGSLITANLANSYNREVFALPGRYTDSLSAGCNALIKHNKAVLIESAEDILKHMLWNVGNDRIREKQAQLMLSLSSEESKIIDYLNTQDSVSIEKLAEEMSIQINKISPILLGLELRGLISGIPGNRYKLI